MLTVRQIFDQMMAVVGVDNADYAPPALRDRVLAGIQEELQVMQMAGEDFYCREHESIAIEENTASYPLAKGIQKVLEPVRFTKTLPPMPEPHYPPPPGPLHRLDSREQYDDFGPVFLWLAGRAVPRGIPQAFFVESLARKDDSDSVKVTLLLTPTPDAAGTLTFDCIKTPPQYTAADLCAAVHPPVPHAYHESILLPLCRKNVTTCTHFKRHAALLPEIQASYERALGLLGLADPRKPKPAQSRNEIITESKP